MKGMATMALAETRKGVDTVMEILNATNYKHGTVNFAMQPFDLRAEVTRIFEQFKGAAEEKQLGYTLSIAGNVNYAVVGDAPQRVRRSSI